MKSSITQSTSGYDLKNSFKYISHQEDLIETISHKRTEYFGRFLCIFISLSLSFYSCLIFDLGRIVMHFQFIMHRFFNFVFLLPVLIFLLSFFFFFLLYFLPLYSSFSSLWHSEIFKHTIFFSVKSMRRLSS
jgi:hypothetical protein